MVASMCMYAFVVIGIVVVSRRCGVDMVIVWMSSLGCPSSPMDGLQGLVAVNGVC